MTPDTHDPLVRALTGLTRIPPDQDRAAAVRERCARHYAARHAPPERAEKQGGRITLAAVSAAYLVEIARVVVRLYAP